MGASVCTYVYASEFWQAKEEEEENQLPKIMKILIRVGGGVGINFNYSFHILILTSNVYMAKNKWGGGQLYDNSLFM